MMLIRNYLLAYSLMMDPRIGVIGEGDKWRNALI